MIALCNASLSLKFIVILQLWGFLSLPFFFPLPFMLFLAIHGELKNNLKQYTIKGKNHFITEKLWLGHAIFCHSYVSIFNKI